MTTKTFQFREGLMTVKKDTVQDQPVIKAELAGYTVNIKYADKERRDTAFDKLDRRNAEVIYRSLESLVSQYDV